jgi:methylase of polypeptide subunit release factors
MHHMMTLRTDGKLHVTPLPEYPQKILDLGTGTGIWAIEMGDKYPSAQV